MAILAPALEPARQPTHPTVGGEALDPVRAWLARELHDGAVQRLTAMVVELEGLKRHGAQVSDLENLQASARGAVGDLRQLLYELRGEPRLVSGFAETLRLHLSEFAAATGIDADLIVHSWPEHIQAHQAANLGRIVGEALTNVRRHSAASRVTVTLQLVNAHLAVTVCDNGRGMHSGGGGFGVRGMRERASLLGGRLTLDGRPGSGTTVRCVLPLGESR
ncbi:MAG: ATP-binding protein [Candidatus Dormibacteria bacterium]|nr:hypothetical protein [Chloroflexota bacterium]